MLLRQDVQISHATALLFVVDRQSEQVNEHSQAYQCFQSRARTAELWHGRFEHFNYAALANMQRLGLIPGCTVTPAQFMQAAREPCKPCIHAKNAEALHPLGDDETNVLLGLIAFDTSSQCRAVTGKYI